MMSQDMVRGTSSEDTGVIAPVLAAHPEGQTVAHAKSSSMMGLAIASIGVVYGDIGTSPLYALRESLAHTRKLGFGDEAVVGTVSMLLWALFFTVTAKYVLFLMRADNKGEGGTLSLMALAQKALGRRSTLVFFLGCRRCGAVLGRRDHHARNLGASRHSRAWSSSRHSSTIRAWYSRCPLPSDPGDAVLRAAHGNREGRRLLRADHGFVLHRDRAARRAAHR